MTRLIAFVFFVLALAIAPSALAFTPPPMTAHVTDTAHKLTEPERIAIDRKLEDYRVRTGNEIAVFVAASLEGEPIADVATDTGRAWKIGVKGVSNGILLVVAPAERKAFIATGKGSEGALTDLQANDIVREKMRPHLLPGHEDYRAAIDVATDAIIADLDSGGLAGHSSKSTKPVTAGDAMFGLVFLLLMIGIPILFMIVIIRAIARAFTSNGQTGRSGWSSGSSWSNDSSWSSGGGGGGDWGGGGGGGGGDSGFSGGGGDFGGGGGGDSF